MNINYEFACQDDCLDKMLPSDLRQLVNERDQAYRNIDALTAERDAFAIRLEDSEEQYSELHNKNSALKAQVEALRDAGQRLWDSPESTSPEDIKAEADLWLDLKSALESTPQHHLAQIRTEAVKEFARKLGDAFILPHSLRKETQKAEFYKAGWRDAFLFANQYANQIRREVE